MKPANYAPIYCALYPQLAEIAREHGYAMAVHGSMARDFDIVCVPWTDTPGTPDDVIADITCQFTATKVGGLTKKNQGRIVQTLSFAFGESALDLSFMPVAAVGAVDVNFIPDANHTIEDMANVGYALMQRIADIEPTYHWNECPTEIVSDLINARDEAVAALAPKPPERRAPVQGYSRGIPWSMHLDAYDVYCKRYSEQQALIEGGCRGGFSTGELDGFIPGWRERLSEMGQLKARVAELELKLAAKARSTITAQVTT